ncbi:unnamed protein product [Mytilus coruscus]|uniref:Uncharacterized protein n=1 Tax=Mytilus coruscus TaxID=42192 RepID=A0A6J8BVV2_MYTCO|nr:unnamed protein product [Mytilus coruscus]
MLLLFETPEKDSTLEQPVVPVVPAVIEDCCHTSRLDSIEPVDSQLTPQCDLLPFSTGMELIFTPLTARIVVDSPFDCYVAATAQEDGITISAFSEEEIKAHQESDRDLMFILPDLKDGKCQIQSHLDRAPTRAVMEEPRSWRPSSGNSQPGVGIQPFDTSVLDGSSHRRVVRKEEPVKEDTVSLEVPAIPEVMVSEEQEVPVVVQGSQEETPAAPEETPAAPEEAPVAQEGEQSAAVTANTTPMAFKKVIPDAWKGKESQVWTGPYSGFKELHLVWAEPVVAQSTQSAPVVQLTVQVSAPVVQPTVPSSTPVVPPTVTEVQPAIPEEDMKSVGRVTPPVEEPVAVAAPISRESLVVLVYRNTRKMVTVINVETALMQARDLFDLEEEEVVLTYQGAEITRSVKIELLPAMAELLVVVRK